jgi:uncharacterized membrane protein (Fun14 family)
MTIPDVIPLVSAVGGGFILGILPGSALKKVITIDSRGFLPC